MKRALATALSIALIVSAFTLSAPRDAEAAYAPPAIKVAFVRSEVSQEWVNSYGRGYGILEKQDFLHAYLVKQGWDVTLIHDADLENISTLRKYDVVVSLWVFSMSTKASKTVTQYVGEGGGLVVPYASSRVASGEGASETGDHWVKLLNHESWEWGPLSEVNQTNFIDDVGAFKFVAKPVTNDPIVTTAKSILQTRGESTAVMDLYRDQPPGAWIEYIKGLSGNTNTVSFLNLTQLSAPTGSTNYSIAGKPGAVRSTYLSGRSVYFYFGATDFVFNQDGSGSRGGVDQAAVAGAYIESAIIWAAGSGGRPGVITRDGRAYAMLNVYNDGIYATTYVANYGNVSVNGTLTYRIYDPSGRLVKQTPRYKIAIVPGATGGKYSESYRVSGLAKGQYRVEIEYVTSYPSYERRYIESLTVVRGQGQGLRTKHDTRTSGRRVYDPRVARVAGATRYATSLAVADAAGGYPRPGGYVVIAGGSGPDALAASSIAGAYDAPLVLTPKAALPTGTDAWLRNSAKGFDKAIIVGGTAAVSADVEKRLRVMFGATDVERFAGGDRYATSVVVARKLKEKLGSAYDGGMIVCNGNALADAAGASAIAVGRKWPIVYVERDAIPAGTSAMISEITSQASSPEAWIVGGVGVVGTGMETALAAKDLTVRRAAGADRYETAARLADLAEATGSNYVRTGLASGRDLADALCLGSHVGRSDGVMLLTNGTSLTNPVTNRFVAAKSRIKTVVVAGGTAAVSDDLCARVSGLLP